VTRGISGTKVTVASDDRPRPARHLPEIRRIIGSSSLSPRVKERSLSTFERLARAEGAIHGIPAEKVHFHEIGAVDSLVDIVGFFAALEILGITRVHSSPVPLGTGSVQTEHGMLPVPAPAALALLSEAGAPTRPHPAETEILTPTAAALLAETARFSYPSMILGRVGYGVGAKELPWANVVRAWTGEASDTGDAPDAVVCLECNLDNARGDDLGHVMDLILHAGALDIWFTPIQMKKNRPAVMLSILCKAEDADRMAEILLRETPTYGVRLSPPLSRKVAGRNLREVRTPWGIVRIKEKTLDGMIVSLDPEYEDCVRIAREHSLPLADVRKAAEQAARGGNAPAS
jgi:uncharacterized protein (TIGR00299 family) protein